MEESTSRSLLHEGPKRRNRKILVFKWKNENGRPLDEGKRNGFFKEWNEDGTLISVEKYEENNLVESILDKIINKVFRMVN